MDTSKMKKRIRMSAIALVITLSASLSILRNSHVRVVEVLPILACGIALGALISNITMMNFLKRNNTVQ